MPTMQPETPKLEVAAANARPARGGIASGRLLPGWAAGMGVLGGAGAAVASALLAQKLLSLPQVLYVSAGFAVLGGLSGVMGVLVGLRVMRSWPAFGLVTAGGTSALCAAFLFLATNQGRIGNERPLHLLGLVALLGMVCASGGGLAIVARSRAAMVLLVKGLAASALVAGIGAGVFLLLRGGTPGWMVGGAKAGVIVAAVLGGVGLVALVSYAGHALIRAFEVGTDAAPGHRDGRRS